MSPPTPSTPTVFIHAYGCQMSKLDGELILSQLKRAGYALAASPAEADVVLFNTCAVREHAEDRVYSNLGALRALKRRRPAVIIGLMGCIAQKDGARVFQRAPHVDIVCGTRAFHRVAEFVEAARRGEGPILALDEDGFETPERDIAARPNRGQAFVAAMRGCDNFCAYCVVPYVRGREISRPIEEIEAEVRRLVDDGVREVTLLGQNINSYGKGLQPRRGLADLLESVAAVPGLARLRFITSHPKDMTREVFQAMRHLPAVCESLHLPAQSGNDRVLRDMRRGYTRRRYLDLVAMARDIVHGITLASDFIVGFPGETEAEFQDTVSLAREVRFQNCFVFKYSPRPGTAAARMADDVPPEVKRWRNIELLAVQEAISAEDLRRRIGQTAEVFVEGPSRKVHRLLTGRTRTNEIVHFPGPPSLAGSLVRVAICDATPLTLSGRLAPASNAGGPPCTPERSAV